MNLDMMDELEPRLICLVQLQVVPPRPRLNILLVLLSGPGILLNHHSEII